MKLRELIQMLWDEKSNSNTSKGFSSSEEEESFERSLPKVSYKRTITIHEGSSKEPSSKKSYEEPIY